MRKSIAAASVAASLLVGGVSGMLVAAPGLAGAAEVAASPVSWVQDALGGLVSDGTITQEQADAVATALQDARPARGFGGHVDLSTVATTLGMTEDELTTALQDGSTLADLATAHGVSTDAVVAAIVAAQQQHLADEVAEGDLTQAEADAKSADAQERATAIVNGEAPVFGHGHGGFGGDRGGPPPVAASADTAADVAA